MELHEVLFGVSGTKVQLVTATVLGEGGLSAFTVPGQSKVNTGLPLSNSFQFISNPNFSDPPFR